MTLIHSILFHILHFVIRTVLILLLCTKSVYRGTARLFEKLFKVVPTEAELLKEITNNATEFVKIPRHIGFVFNEAIAITHVAKLVAWCIAVGVKDISLSDCDDYLKTEISALYKAVHETIAKTLTASSIPNLLIHTYKESNSNSISNKEVINSSPDDYECDATHNHVNGDISNYKGKKEVNVLVLNSCDGRSSVVEVARTLCHEIQAKKFDPKDLNKSIFSKRLLNVLKVPDPDLVFCFGKGNSIFGYLPWNIHLSEIMFHSSHIHFELCDFLNSLGKYNKCEQRFGT